MHCGQRVCVSECDGNYILSLRSSLHAQAEIGIVRTQKECQKLIAELEYREALGPSGSTCRSQLLMCFRGICSRKVTTAQEAEERLNVLLRSGERMEQAVLDFVEGTGGSVDRFYSCRSVSDASAVSLEGSAGTETKNGDSTKKESAESRGSSLEEDFRQAVTFVQSLPPGGSVPNVRKLICYGLFKQATQGDNPDPNRPSMMRLEKRYKWDAWETNRGRLKEDCMRAYVTEVQKLSEEFRDVR
eukprot:TRINITY_DN83081_c0_g1_i1.p1 TRINITY_DN83081_c0_g1~~TRINITY_DN83081_c0_g1_i1.p1  ORF type:complete len:244 (-),score=54.26 TRINITY_DN83081_c0_g1_i1:35-766(-)